MNMQVLPREMRSVEPIMGLSPIYSIHQKATHKVFRAQCMIPFMNYSIKIVYIITFIAFKIYVRIEIFLIPMVQPRFMAIDMPEQTELQQLHTDAINPIPLANYSFNCLYCVRCNLGMSCKSHVCPASNNSSSQVEQKLAEQQE